ncbi:mechanosensitive ion channel family protein [Caenimonas aquaedulcis]|uniref:Mechanosensitive ion channel n=1 Tax=Caenimonas aquaedulcis TaxID=2793270 RepID=A0A931H8V4_9BURK|nr:mechanosensitive ion channel family protein [Caenimonas aquaedulcis]MBG9390532.1 mechanosensitive ion channel [Caenimonas aquaedulcis]
MLKQFLTKKFIAVAGANILLAVASVHFLESPVGWLSATRANAGGLIGDGIPFLQFIAFASLVEEVMWTLARRNVDSKGGTRVPRLALQIATFVIYVVMLSSAISLVFEKSLAAILGASGILGLVLGFALRGLVSDIFSGIALQIDASLAPGDWLDFQYRGRDLSGKLLDIAWRTVVIADTSENIVIIPNGEFAAIMVTNRSRPTPVSEYSTTIELDASHDEARVMAILETAVDRALMDGVLSRPAPYIRVAGVKEGIITYRLLYCLEVGRISPTKARHTVLFYALQFLKAAGVPVTRTLRNEIARPGEVGQFHFDHAGARLQMLSSVNFLSILPPVDLAKVAEEVRTSRLIKGQRLLVAGEPGDSMFVVSEGSLDVVIESEAGPVTVGHLWPGDCLGEMSLFTGAPRSATVVAREPSVTFEVRKDTMAGIFEHNPALIERVAHMIARRQKANESALHKPQDAVQQRAEERSIFLRIRDFFRLRPDTDASRAAALAEMP